MSESDHVTGRQIAAARTLLGLSQGDLAEAARVSIATLRRMEAADGRPPGMPNNVLAVVSTLEAQGIEFCTGDAPGLRVRRG